LFNALTRAQIAAENFLLHIDPNVAWCGARSRLEKLAAIVHPEKILRPRWNSWTSPDCAGASKGEGLGNKFLAHIREVDAIAHVVRCFENENHSRGRQDRSVSDIE